ncbi:hypothetical protein [Chenggangzhangella methanolivorans]|uniref:hypothetical protein n=1 Tax=Chenggangzhangella methanolivorans TaxID=1437009 RepID=UPI0021BDD977|nr:hypothetical protein [Chenggangzhangella methanolivorans]
MRLGAVLLAPLALAACAETGDFGRPKPNVLNDAVYPAMGAALAYQRDEPVSAYRLTDNEREMRDFGWGIVMPPLEGQRRDRILTELRRTRILPADRARLDRASYVRTLIATDYRSSRARYAKLKDDVVNDTLRVEPFFAAASRVARDDRARARALADVPEVTPAERENATARIDENGMMIAWARESLDERLDSYRYALDRLMLETPDPYSNEVASAIDAFAAVLASLRPLGPARGIFKS